MADNLDDVFNSLSEADFKDTPPSVDDAFSSLEEEDLLANPPETWTQKLSNMGRSAYKTIDKGVEAVTGSSLENVNEDMKRTIDEIGGVPGATDAVLGVVGDVVAAPFKVAAPVFDAISQGLGTGLAYSIDGYRGLLGYDSMVDKAKLQDLDQRLKANRDENGNPFEKIGMDTKSFPIRLADLARDPTRKYMDEFGQYLQTSDNSAVKTMGEWVEGFAPSTAEAAGLLAEIYGTPIPKIGRLTELGTNLAKEDRASLGLAQQIAKGERQGFELEFKMPGMNGSYAKLLPNKVTAKTVDKLQDMAMEFEASRPGQWLRKYTTMPSLPIVGRSGQELAYAENFIDSQKAEYGAQLKNKAEQMGIEWNDPAIRKRFQSYIENPTHVKDPMKEQFETLYQNAYADLQKDVEQARAMGIPVNDKFESTTIGPIRAKKGFQERYVPRYPEPGNVQLKQMSELLGDQEKAAQTVEELGLADSGMKKSSTGFLNERSPYNTQRMNQIVEEKTGIKGFFSDDPLDAFARKRAEIQRAIEKRKFADGVLSSAGKTRNDWILLRNEAAKRVKDARAQGQIPDLMDVKLSKIDIKNLQKLGDVGEQLNKVNKSTDFTQLMLPKSDADFVQGMLKAPDRNALNAYMNSYMRAWKGATFFNPGFIGRNSWENYTRAMQSDLSHAELAQGQAAYIFGKGKLAKYVDEYNAFENKLGVASDVEKTAGSKITAPLEAALLENPETRTLNTLHEMSMRGKVKNFFNVSKKLDKVADNPLFRWARSVNNGAENSYKFSYYAKLREQGYSVKAALKEADANFMGYNLMRNSVSQKQAYIPFLNYMIKNAETTAKLFMKNPRGALTFAPGGALERAIEHWSGWDPNQVEDFKKIHGEYYTDRILGTFLPGKEAMMQEKDYVKMFLNNWLDPDGSKAGYQLWANLPSNYHGLMSLDPRRANQMAGPILKMGLMLAYGVDPSTGEKILGADDKIIGPTQRVMKALDEGTNAFIPEKAINAARGLLAQKLPEAREKFTSLGMSPQVIETVLGPEDNKKFKARMDKAFLATKMLYMGTATKVDVDIMVRQQAEMQRLQKALSQMMSSNVKNGRGLTDSIKRTKNVLMKASKDLLEFINIKEDYDKRLEAADAPPEQSVEFKDIIDETLNPQINEREDEPSDEEIMNDSIDGAFNTLSPEELQANPPQRMPAQFVQGENQPVNNMWDQRAQDIIKKYNLDLNNPKEKQFLDDMLRNEIQGATPSLPEIMQGNKRSATT